MKFQIIKTCFMTIFNIYNKLIFIDRITFCTAPSLFLRLDIDSLGKFLNKCNILLFVNDDISTIIDKQMYNTNKLNFSYNKKM